MILDFCAEMYPWVQLCKQVPRLRATRSARDDTPFARLLPFHCSSDSCRSNGTNPRREIRSPWLPGGSTRFRLPSPDFCLLVFYNRTMSQLYAGTSGFAYATWKPDFYPADVKQKDFLSYYSQRLNSVEINYTFRQLP